MATISSPGIGSGLDVNGIVSQLMALERRPVDNLETATTRFNTQLSAFGRLQSGMTALRDAARKLTDAANWSPSTVTTSDALSVSATSNGQSPPGSYSVSVSQLASAQTLASTTFSAGTDVVGSGTLTIELGTWGAGQTAFTAKADATAVTLTIPPEASTLADIRDAINAAGAGVSASIVTDATGARLALRSTTTGEANAFRISVVEGDGDGNGGVDPGLGRLAFDPSSGVSGMNQTLASANALATINGVQISAETNTLTDVLDGLTVKLGRVTTAAVDLSVTRDDAVIRKSITDFAAAYNDLVKINRELTRYDEGTQSAGTLQGDRSAVGLLSSLRSLVGSTSGATTGFTRLSQIGLEPQSDGSLKVNDAKLTTAMSRISELKTFFSRNEAGTAQDGFGVLLRDFGDGALSSEGVLTTRQQGLKDRISRNAEATERLEQRLELVERRLRERYTRLDTSIAQLNGLQNYVTQQIANWNSSSN